MNLIISWRLIVPMAILAILIAACGNAESTEPDSESNSTSITPIEVPTPTVLAEAIVSPLGLLLDDYIAKDNPLFSGSILVAWEG